MTYKYVNRKNLVYYLQEKTDDNGNKEYFFTRQKQINDLEDVPEGYSVFEEDSGKVILKKKN